MLHARFRKLCSKPGAPSTKRTRRRTRGRLNQHAAAVVLGNELASSYRHLDGVNRRGAAWRRHLEALMNRHPVGDRSHAPNLQRPAVLEQSQRDRVGTVAMAHGDDIEIDAGLVEGCIRRRSR